MTPPTESGSDVRKLQTGSDVRTPPDQTGSDVWSCCGGLQGCWWSSGSGDPGGGAYPGGRASQSSMASSWSARSSNMLPMSSRMFPAAFTVPPLPPSVLLPSASLFSTTLSAASSDVLVCSSLF